MTDFLFLAAGAVVVLVAFDLAQRQAGQGTPEQGGALPDQAPEWFPAWGAGEPDQNPSMMDSILVSMTPSTYDTANVAPDEAAANTRAFLDMIAYSEGTAGHGDDGYNLLFGYRTFDSYADHPRQYIPFGNTTTSAAGRYQILARTWDGLRDKINLPDFSPASQDAAAVELIRERGALADVQAGRFDAAVRKVAKVWASLPGAGYNQPERNLNALRHAYASAGGTINEV